MSRNRKRRDKLWDAKNGKCFWCGISTILPPRNARSGFKANYATLDHLRTRLDPNRRDPNNNNEERSVLACLNCNCLRGRLIQLSQSPKHIHINGKVKINNILILRKTKSKNQHEAMCFCGKTFTAKITEILEQKVRSCGCCKQ